MTALLRDLGHLRAFIAVGRAEWRQDGEPYARSLQTLSKLINGPTKDYGSTLWKLAIDIPVVLMSGDEGYAAADLSQARPDDLIRSLIQGWAEEPTSSYSEHALPSDTHRRVLNLLPTLPPDTWIDRGSFERLLSFLWPLKFNAKTTGSNKPISGDWGALYATVLGKGNDDEQHESFSVQSAGMEIVFAQAPQPDLKLPDWDTSWIVQPDRTVVAPPNAHPDSILDLWNVADLIENQGASIFRVSADSISAALNNGMTPDEIAGLFERHSRTPMPATIERVIRDQSQRYGQVRVGNATAYLEVDDPGVLDEIVRNAKLDRLDIQVIAPTVAVVRGTDDATTIASLRKSGYLPVQATVKAKSNSKPTPIRATQTQDEIKTLLRGAINDLRLARVQWNSPEYGTLEYVMEPANIRHATLAGYEANSGEMVEMPVSSILSVRLLTAAESKKYSI